MVNREQEVTLYQISGLLEQGFNSTCGGVTHSSQLNLAVRRTRQNAISDLLIHVIFVVDRNSKHVYVDRQHGPVVLNSLRQRPYEGLEKCGFPGSRWS